MSIRRKSKPTPLAKSLVELAVAVPQVVVHRVIQIALAGVSPSTHDREEFHRMSAEKVAAFNESWTAMAKEVFRANQQLTLSLMRSLWSPWGHPLRSVKSASSQLSNAALGILEKGMAPVHRRAVANAKRLRRPKA